MGRKSKKQKRIEDAQAVIRRLSPKQIIAIILVIVFVAIIGFLIYWFVLKEKPMAPSQLAEGDLKIHFIDIGQGDSAFLQLPNGKNMIIDGGEDKKKQALLDYLKSLDIKQIDYMVLSHTDSDHIGGLDDVLEAYEVKKVYKPDFTTEQITTVTYKNFLQALENEEGVQVEMSVDDSDIDESGYLIDFYVLDELYEDKSLTAEEKNAVSPLMFLQYANKKILFTGDANEKTEGNFLQKIQGKDKKYFDVDVLKIGHHGSDTSTTREFLNIVKPEYSVISVGEGNTYLHPRQDTLNRLKEIDNTIYRTDKNGNITLTIKDSGELIFESQRQVTQEENYTGFVKTGYQYMNMNYIYNIA